YDVARERAALAARLEEELAAIPAASAVALTTALPGIGAARRPVAVEGSGDPVDATLPVIHYIAASPGFFELFRAPILAGRGFDVRDREGALPVAVVNQAFERRYLPAGAVGHRIALPAQDGEQEWLTIVGVVPDLLPGGFERDLVEAVYRPLAQAAPPEFRLAVRSNGDPSTMAAPVREAVASTDPDLALSFMRALDEAIALANSQYRWLSMLFLVAGALALFLAAIGLYGVMAFWVAQRTREIGVRMALGGNRGTIIRLVLRQAMMPIGLGVLVGLLIAAPLAWLSREGLLDVQPFDPFVFGTVSGVLLAAGWLGCILPALRATRVDPQVALASE
ncbi:MAG: FtsX-like permease family protein, partial [Longimicrobiales bacterium]